MDNISDKQREMLKRVCMGFSVDILVAVLVDVYGMDDVFDTVFEQYQEQRRMAEQQGVKLKGD